MTTRFFHPVDLDRSPATELRGASMPLDHRIRRVIIVVLDGLRPDAIDAFDLAHIRHVMANGAWSRRAQTIGPSLTTAAMTSLMTGVCPQRHGIKSDTVIIPRGNVGLTPMPELLAMHRLPSSAFLGDVMPIFRGLASRVARRLGFATSKFSGRDAPSILEAATPTLEEQRRGLVVIHWPDADRAGHAHGWMSNAYADACSVLDGTLGMLTATVDLGRDPETMLIALADHGGGGAESKNHESDHPLDRTIPLMFAGRRVARGELQDARLLDVPPTVLAALGVPIPASYEGRALREALARVDEPAGAVA